MNKQWEQAGITNDYVFNQVMNMGDNALHLIQQILPELHIKDYANVTTQQEVKDQAHQKGVRFDVFVEDDQERIYDIEMQVINHPDFGKRIRYYQSKLDTISLGEGHSYRDIKESYIICLLPYDPAGLNRKRYTYHLRCDECPELILNTNSTIILLNSHGSFGKVTNGLQSFFELMNGQQQVVDPFGQSIEQAVFTVKMNPAKERDFMDLEMKLADARNEGISQGISQGMSRGKKQGMKQGIQQGMKQGMKQGIEQGIQQGKKQGTLDAAKKVIARYQKLSASNDFIETAIKSDFGDSLSGEDIDNLLNSLK